MRIYFDHNATTPLDPRVRDAVVAALDVWGNPSSVHAEGRDARDLIETARRQVAGLLDAAPEQVVFTSGGTEADRLGITGLARAAMAAGRPPTIAVLAIDHPAVVGPARALGGGSQPASAAPAGDAHAGAFRCLELPVDAAGCVDLTALERACRDGLAVLAIALANHELGTVQDVVAAARAVHAAGGFVHCDAVQATGKLPLSVAELEVDSLAISGHKIYGPKGAGALWIRGGIDLAPWPGGHQERERRPGTENVPGIAGLGAAAELALVEGLAEHTRVRELTEELERGLIALGATIHGGAGPRVGNTVNAGFEGALGEVVVTALDLAGISASTGAACTSGTVAPSPALLGIGLPEARAREGVRFSLGRGNSREEVKALLEKLPAIIKRAKEFK